MNPTQTRSVNGKVFGIGEHYHYAVCQECGDWINLHYGSHRENETRIVCQPCYTSEDIVSAPYEPIPAEYEDATLSDFPPSVRALASKWPSRTPCMATFGPPGFGKTRLCYTLVLELRRGGYNPTMISCRSDRQAWIADQNRAAYVARWSKTKYLLVDDLTAGAAPGDGWTAMLDAVLDHRRERKLPTFITTMESRNAVIRIFGQAFYSRLQLFHWIRWPKDWKDQRGEFPS